MDAHGGVREAKMSCSHTRVRITSHTPVRITFSLRTAAEVDLDDFFFCSFGPVLM